MFILLTNRILLSLIIANQVPKKVGTMKNINNSIIIIDDDKWIIKLARNMLEKYGFTVLEATTPHEGLELIIKESPLLVLLDLSLPNIDGDSLLYLIKHMSMTKDTKVVILSALITKEKIKSTYQLGAAAFIAKPFEEKLLIQKINECLDKDSINKLKKETPIKDEFFIKI